MCLAVFKVIKSEKFTDPQKVQQTLNRKNMDVAGKFIPYQPPEDPVKDENIKDEDVDKVKVRAQIQTIMLHMFKKFIPVILSRINIHIV